jgi:hypothetical protein
MGSVPLAQKIDAPWHTSVVSKARPVYFRVHRDAVLAACTSKRLAGLLRPAINYAAALLSGIAPPFPSTPFSTSSDVTNN